MSDQGMMDAIAGDTSANPPRLRASFDVANPMNVTNTWTTVPFKISGTYDQDTFPGGRFDTVNNKLVAKAGEVFDRQYDVEFFYKLSVPALSLPRQDIQLRFVVPAPTPIYFPFPDGDGFVDLEPALSSPVRKVYKQVLYFNNSIRQYGVMLQLRTSATLLVVNQPQLLDGALSLFARG